MWILAGLAVVATTGCPGPHPPDASDAVVDIARPDTPGDTPSGDAFDADARDVVRTDAVDSALDAEAGDDATPDIRDVEAGLDVVLEAGEEGGRDGGDDAPSDGTADAGDEGRACASNRDCDPTAFCAKAACDAALGRCEARPDTGPPPGDCGPTTDPYVCGCDGRTYNSACHAHALGVNVAPGGRWECRVNDDCPRMGFCFTAYCGGPGECRRAGTVSCSTMLACGCDGTTARDCELYAARVNTAWVGHRCSIPPAAGEACRPLMTTPAPCAAGLRCIPLATDPTRGVCGP